MSLENERGQWLEEVGRKALICSLYRIRDCFPSELAADFASVDETEKRIEEKNREMEALKLEAEAKEKAEAEKAAQRAAEEESSAPSVETASRRRCFLPSAEPSRIRKNYPTVGAGPFGALFVLGGPEVNLFFMLKRGREGDHLQRSFPGGINS